MSKFAEKYFTESDQEFVELNLMHDVELKKNKSKYGQMTLQKNYIYSNEKKNLNSNSQTKASLVMWWMTFCKMVNFQKSCYNCGIKSHRLIIKQMSEKFISITLSCYKFNYHYYTFQWIIISILRNVKKNKHWNLSAYLNILTRAFCLVIYIYLIILLY